MHALCAETHAPDHMLLLAALEPKTKSRRPISLGCIKQTNILQLDHIVPRVRPWQRLGDLDIVRAYPTVPNARYASTILCVSKLSWNKLPTR